MSIPILAYWDIRGLAQPIRLLLEFTGTEFEDKYYKCGPAPSFDKSCWFDIKNSLGMDFPNLPYFIDGDIKITQSNAILRYIGRKNYLCGKTDAEKVRVDMLENESMDFRNGLIRLCYNPNFETLKPEYLKQLLSILKKFSDFLGERKFFAGDSVLDAGSLSCVRYRFTAPPPRSPGATFSKLFLITFPDFVMYELLDQHRLLSPDCLKDFENLRQFLDRFESLEPIKAYMASNRFLKAPLNNKMAKFGNE